jgi:hypothetical protein
VEDGFVAPAFKQLEAPASLGGAIMNKPTNLQKPSLTKELRLANRAFIKDLPELIKTHLGSWTAYLASERKGISPDRDALLRKYRQEYEDGVLLLARIRERASLECMGF